MNQTSGIQSTTNMFLLTLQGFVPQSLKVKLQNQASQFSGNSPTTPTPSNPKCQAKAISCNLTTCGNELKRSSAPKNLSKSWLGPFLLQLGGVSRQNLSPHLWGANWPTLTEFNLLKLRPQMYIMLSIPDHAFSFQHKPGQAKSSPS